MHPCLQVNRIAEMAVSQAYNHTLVTCRHYGDSYKWLLYGDDDTLFFPHALKHTLQDLDPNVPYFLTGAVLLVLPCQPQQLLEQAAAPSSVSERIRTTAGLLGACMACACDLAPTFS